MAAYCFNCFHPAAPGETVCPRCGRDHVLNDQPPFALPLGTLLHAGKFLVGRVLGQGGFGITYVGFDLALEMKVAVKEFFPVHMASRSQGAGSLQWHSTAAERDLGKESFVKEARKMAKTHAIPNVVAVRDVFFENETAYIVMDFLEGETLRDRLQRTGPMTPKTCTDVLRPVMAALEKVHQRGIIHRDISPDNLMLDAEGELWLLDLGAAKDLSVGQGAQSTAPVMKRGFSPPEQYVSGGRIGPWTDVYAMCATIYYCVTCRLVPESVERMMGAELALPENFPQAWNDALLRGLALRSEERIQSIAELSFALEDALRSNAGASIPAMSRESAVSALPKRTAGIVPEEWMCACGALNRESAKFCPHCGTQKPPLSAEETWLCACGYANRGGAKFCANCGMPRLRAEAPARAAVPAAPVWDGARLNYVVRDGGAVITGCAGEPVSLEIPAVLDGAPVTEIADGAFAERLTLRKVLIHTCAGRIGASAFFRCANLQSVQILNGVTAIGSSAFYECFALRSLSLPASLNEIQQSAFMRCDALTNVYFNGTKADWKRLRIAYNNNALKKAALYFRT